jgi:hypothetical protein
MAMQRFALAVGKDQKMRRRKIEIIFRHFDTEGSRHPGEGNQKRLAFQA